MPKVLDLPEVHVGRCKFPRPFRNLTTFNTGEIVPLFYDCNVTPGDVVKVPIKALLRMQTPLYPVMDNLVFDVSVWFVPDRITWNHFVNFWGENDSTYWEQPTTYEIPQIESPNGGWTEYSLADYLGIPTKVSGISVSQMPFRAYCKIYNDFWRDENLKEPIFYNEDETTLTGKNYDPNTYDYTTDTQLGAKLMIAAKRADYMTKALPEPQKGPDVMMPLGTIAPIKGISLDAAEIPTGSSLQSELVDKPLGFGRVPSPGYVDYMYDVTDPTNTQGDNKVIGLAADLSNALGATVNQLRTAVALQRYYETIARSGWAKAMSLS